MSEEHRSVAPYDQPSSSLFTSGSPSSPTGLAVTGNATIARMQQEILQICNGHIELATQLYKALEHLTAHEAQTVVNTLTQLSAMHRGIQDPEVRAGFELYLRETLTRLLGQVRGITDVTLSHLARQLTRSLEPLPAPVPPAQKGVIRRLFG